MARTSPDDPSRAPQGGLGWRRSLTLGIGAGLLSGVLTGFLEATWVVLTSSGVSWGLLFPAGVVYGANGLVLGLLAGVVLGVVAQVRPGDWQRQVPAILAVLFAVLFSFVGGFILAHRVRRDIYAEQLIWSTGAGMLVSAICTVIAIGIGVAAFLLMRRWLLGHGRFLLRPWGTPAFVGTVLAVLFVVIQVAGNPAEAALSRSRAPAPTAATNVILLVVDTLRADRLPHYGWEQGSTPNLDAFAEDAVRFEHAYSNSSWTRPSFATLLTGRLPSSHGVMLKSSALPSAIDTLPEVLGEHGYATAGIVSNYNSGPYFNFQQGFDLYHFLQPDFMIGSDDSDGSGVRVDTEAFGKAIGSDIVPVVELLLLSTYRHMFAGFRSAGGAVVPGTVYQDAERVNARVFRWLETAPDDPFFLMVGYMDPHHPYFEHPYSGIGYSRSGHPEPEMSDIPEMERLYDHEIRYWDEHFGALMDRLREQGLYDDTMIIVTSDHGEEFGDHGGFWHGTTLYDEQVHVPFYVKLPGSRRGGTSVSHWVQLADVMPSVLEQVGIDVPEGVQGTSIWEGLDVLYSEEDHEGHALESLRERTEDMDEYKLILANPGNARGLDEVELYRPDEDPDEQENRAEAEPERAREMIERVGSARQEASDGAVEGSSVPIDGETCRRLVSLGYVESEEDCDQVQRGADER